MHSRTFMNMLSPQSDTLGQACFLKHFYGSAEASLSLCLQRNIFDATLNSSVMHLDLYKLWPFLETSAPTQNHTNIEKMKEHNASTESTKY